MMLTKQLQEQAANLELLSARDFSTALDFSVVALLKGESEASLASALDCDEEFAKFVQTTFTSLLALLTKYRSNLHEVKAVLGLLAISPQKQAALFQASQKYCEDLRSVFLGQDFLQPVLKEVRVRGQVEVSRRGCRRVFEPKLVLQLKTGEGNVTRLRAEPGVVRELVGQLREEVRGGGRVGKKVEGCIA